MLEFFAKWKEYDPGSVNIRVYTGLITGSGMHTTLLGGLNTK